MTSKYMAYVLCRKPVFYILLLIDIIIIILFILGYIGRYVHPKHVWWLQLLAISLPVISVMILLITAIAALTGKWVVAAIHVPLIILAFVRFVPFSTLKGTLVTASETGLTVLSFNAKDHNDDHRASANSMRVILSQEQPDILCFQETTVRFFNKSKDIGGDYHIMVPVVKEGGYKIPHPRMASSAAYSRVLHPIFGQLDYLEQQSLHIRSDLDRTSPGTVTRSVFVWKGRSFATFNVHLRSFTPQHSNPSGWQWLSPSFWWQRLELYRRDFLIRAREAEQVRRLLDQESLPFIVCGDFNSTPQNWVYEHIATGLKDAFVMGGRGTGATYHASFPVFRIDYIFTSPDWHIVSAYTAAAAFSDHLPLVAKLELPEESGD